MLYSQASAMTFIGLRHIAADELTVWFPQESTKCNFNDKQYLSFLHFILFSLISRTSFISFNAIIYGHFSQCQQNFIFKAYATITYPSSHFQNALAL